MSEERYTGKELGCLAVEFDINTRLGIKKNLKFNNGNELLKESKELDYKERKIFNEYLTMIYWLDSLFTKRRETLLKLQYSVAVLESLSWTTVLSEVVKTDLEKAKIDMSQLDNAGSLIDIYTIEQSVNNDELVKKYKHFIVILQEGYSFILLYNRVLKFLKERYEIDSLKKMMLTESKIQPVNDYISLRKLMLSAIELKPKESQELAKKQFKTLLPPLKSKKNLINKIGLTEFENFLKLGGSFTNIEAINTILGI